MVKLLTNWRGKPLEDGFDLNNVCGAPAMILVEHNTNDQGTVFANVGTIMPCKRADAPDIPPHIMAIALEHPDREYFAQVAENLSDSLKGKVSDGWARLDALVKSEQAATGTARSPEPGEGSPVEDDLDDEIPF